MERDADAHRLEIAVMNVGGDDGAAAGDFAAHEFGFDFFALGDEEHFFADDAFACQVHLRHVFIAIGSGGFCFPFFDPSVTQCHRAPSLRSQAGRWCRRQRSVLRMKRKYGIEGSWRQPTERNATESQSAQRIREMGDGNYSAAHLEAKGGVPRGTFRKLRVKERGRLSWRLMRISGGCRGRRGGWSTVGRLRGRFDWSG